MHSINPFQASIRRADNRPTGRASPLANNGSTVNLKPEAFKSNPLDTLTQILSPLGSQTEPALELGMETSQQDNAEVQTLLQLRSSFKALEKVEMYFTGFQDELAHVGAEMEILQNRSLLISSRLEVRKTIDGKLAPLTEDLCVVPSLILTLLEEDIGERWVGALNALEYQASNLERDATKDIKAFNEVKEVIDKLMTKALERIRDFYVFRIKTLRTPNANVSVVQQSIFLHYRHLMVFLNRHHEQLAGEIEQAYIHTMSWYYSSHLSRYRACLAKLQILKYDRSALLTSEGPMKRTEAAAPLQTIHGQDLTSLQLRAKILSERDAALLNAFTVEVDKSIHGIEGVFRSFITAVFDNASAEYLFLVDFLSFRTADQISIDFHGIFQDALITAEAFTKQLVEANFDCFGILICIRLVQQLAYDAQHRKVPVLDAFINKLNILLWPRFQSAIDGHCESLRKASVLYKAPGDLNQSASPHPLSQKFSGLLLGLLLLTPEGGDDEPLANSILRLRSEFEACMTKISAKLGDSKTRERFLHNTFALVCAIINDAKGGMAMKEKDHFATLTKAYRY